MTSSSVRLSIVVLTANGKQYTVRLVKSLIPYLELHPDTELIIVDNGSTDYTREAIENILKGHDFRFTYICNSHNIGVARGRNEGIKKASGEYILLLDNDTEVTESAIEGLINYMDNNAGCGLCAPALYSPEGILQDSAKPFPSLWLKICHLFHRNSLSVSERTALESKHPFYVIGACQLFRRRLTQSIGLLDERIFYGPEDADWCIRIRKSGLSVDYLPEVHVTHYWQRSTNIKPFTTLTVAHIRALFYFYRKHGRLI